MLYIGPIKLGFKCALWISDGFWWWIGSDLNHLASVKQGKILGKTAYPPRTSHRHTTEGLELLGIQCNDKKNNKDAATTTTTTTSQKLTWGARHECLSGVLRVGVRQEERTQPSDSLAVRSTGGDPLPLLSDRDEVRTEPDFVSLLSNTYEQTNIYFDCRYIQEVL